MHHFECDKFGLTPTKYRRQQATASMGAGQIVCVLTRTPAAAINVRAGCRVFRPCTERASSARARACLSAPTSVFVLAWWLLAGRGLFALAAFQCTLAHTHTHARPPLFQRRCGAQITGPSASLVGGSNDGLRASVFLCTRNI